MSCPKCSEPQAAGGAQFCSSCGLPPGDLKEAAPARGMAPPEPEGAPLSPRQRGVRQGAVLMLLSVVLIPAYVLLAALFPAEDRLVESSPSDTPFEKISQAILFTLFMAGLARALYALLFLRGAGRGEGGREGRRGGETVAAQVAGPASNRELPPAQSIPASGFGSWRVDTGEVARGRAGGERTTRSLEAE